MTHKKKQEYFLKLYEPIHDKFERFCRARVYGNMDHQDLMNETLLIAFQKLKSLQSKDSFLSYLIGISIRILSNNHKKKREESWPQHPHFDVEDRDADTSRKTEVSILYQALSGLPDEQRECLILFEISGFSIKEIMQIQQVSESAVKQRLRRGRTKLQEVLSDSRVNKIKGLKHEMS